MPEIKVRKLCSPPMPRIDTDSAYDIHSVSPGPCNGKATKLPHERGTMLRLHLGRRMRGTRAEVGKSEECVAIKRRELGSVLRRLGGRTGTSTYQHQGRYQMQQLRLESAGLHWRILTHIDLTLALARRCGMANVRFPVPQIAVLEALRISWGRPWRRASLSRARLWSDLCLTDEEI